MTTLTLEDLSVGYGATPVLAGVDLPALAPGSLVGVLGPNGVGKSTLLRALAGIGTYSGAAILNGEELSSMTQFRRAARIGAAHVCGGSNCHRADRAARVGVRRLDAGAAFGPPAPAAQRGGHADG